LPLQRKPKPARFIHRVHFGSIAPELGHPLHERMLAKSLRRLGISPALLHHYHVKILVHINPKLDWLGAAIKLAADFLE